MVAAVTAERPESEGPTEYHWLSITVIVICSTILLAFVILAMATPEP